MPLPPSPAKPAYAQNTSTSHADIYIQGEIKSPLQSHDNDMATDYSAPLYMQFDCNTFVVVTAPLDSSTDCT